MQPYVIRQGDFLAKLAYRFGFDADSVWNDPMNAQLRQLRPDPNLLWPTDVLYIPDPSGKTPPMQSLSVGSTNTFVADVPTATITLKFADPSFASQAFTIQELPELTGQTSKPDGTVSFPAPVTLDTATLVFTDSGATFACNLGHLDPIDTLSGVFQRLQHLGFIVESAPVKAATLESVRWGLLAFKAAQAQDSLSPDPSPPSSVSPPSSLPSPGSPPSASDPSALSSGPTGGDVAAPASAPLPSEGAAAPLSSPPPPSGDSPPPLSAAPASQPPPSAPPDSGSSTPDNGGLNDDGTLDDETKQTLLSAHGS
jgi:hypothetical protein